MPTRRRYPFRRRRRFRRRQALGLATRSRMFPRRLARKRYQGVDTKLFYFKRNATALSDADGKYFANFNARSINGGTPATPLFPQFAQVKDLYDQYKVLGITIRFFPANVGIEPDSALFTSNALLRGTTVVWNDQRTDTGVTVPTSVTQVINNSSMRMMASRRYFSRSIFRAKGYPAWANIQAPATEDSWNGSINVFVEGATPAVITPPAQTPILFYFTVTYKVLFRGRRSE